MTLFLKKTLLYFYCPFQALFQKLKILVWQSFSIYSIRRDRYRGQNTNGFPTVGLLYCINTGEGITWGRNTQLQCFKKTFHSIDVPNFIVKSSGMIMIMNFKNKLYLALNERQIRHSVACFLPNFASWPQDWNWEYSMSKSNWLLFCYCYYYK